MVLQTLSLRQAALCNGFKACRKYQFIPVRPQSTTASSSSSPQNLAELDPDYSSHAISSPTPEQISSYDPIARSRARDSQLPPSRYTSPVRSIQPASNHSHRYQIRSPRYYRGTLHPHQPPPASNPTSREYIPGPFTNPRLSQTWDATLSHDLMVLGYQHVPPGTPTPPPKQRLRSWDDSSPYHKNRPLRAPRGAAGLPLLNKPITFNNVPTLDKITVSILVRDASSSSAHLHVAGMILQAITTQRAHVYIAKRGMTAGHQISFTQAKDKPIAVGTTMSGEAMWHFMSTLVTVVLPRIKEWSGVKAKSGDRSGNFTVGLTPEMVGGWPEVAVNYDA